MNNVIHSGRYKGVVRGCALMMWISLVGCGHLGPMQQASRPSSAQTGRCGCSCAATTPLWELSGRGRCGATGVGGQARYEETKADQDNGGRGNTLALRSML